MASEVVVVASWQFWEHHRSLFAGSRERHRIGSSSSNSTTSISLTCAGVARSGISARAGAGGDHGSACTRIYALLIC